MRKNLEIQIEDNNKEEKKATAIVTGPPAGLKINIPTSTTSAIG